MSKVVKVSKPKVTAVGNHPTETAWDAPELKGVTKGQIHEYYERMGHEAAARVRKHSRTPTRPGFTAG
ncbi:hypothetical protein HDF11_000518 [Tunturiibacter psychrotolerans]